MADQGHSTPTSISSTTPAPLLDPQQRPLLEPLQDESQFVFAVRVISNLPRALVPVIRSLSTQSSSTACGRLLFDTGSWHSGKNDWIGFMAEAVSQACSVALGRGVPLGGRGNQYYYFAGEATLVRYASDIFNALCTSLYGYDEEISWNTLLGSALAYTASVPFFLARADTHVAKTSTEVKSIRSKRLDFVQAGNQVLHEQFLGAKGEGDGTGGTGIRLSCSKKAGGDESAEKALAAAKAARKAAWNLLELDLEVRRPLIPSPLVDHPLPGRFVQVDKEGVLVKKGENLAGKVSTTEPKAKRPRLDPEWC